MAFARRFVPPVAALTFVLLLAACGDAGYPADLGDDEYDLEAMLLQQDDIPLAMESFGVTGFDNESWAPAFGTDDPSATLAQLEARRRIRNEIVVYAWEDPVAHLGAPRAISAQSTLYEDVEAAEDAMGGFCGLPIDESTAPLTTEFPVRGLGDQSIGLFLTQPDPDLGDIIDTIICFRTGRIVHAISQTGLAGSEDIVLGVRMARRMLERVDGLFGRDS